MQLTCDAFDESTRARPLRVVLETMNDFMDKDPIDLIFRAPSAVLYVV